MAYVLSIDLFINLSIYQIDWIDRQKQSQTLGKKVRKTNRKERETNQKTKKCQANEQETY